VERHDLFPDTSPAAEVTGVVRRFPGMNEVVTALDDITALIPRRQMTVVAGPSGSGKSTLLALLACAQRPDAGTVRIGDTDVIAIGRKQRRELRRDRLGIVLPQPSENLLDQFDAAGNIRWAAARRQSRQPSIVDVDALLAVVGLTAARQRRVRELSGGEQQRLAIACALAGEPELVILDEPTASLDRASGSSVVEVLAASAAAGSTMVIASHDAMVIDAADYIIGLDHGRRVQ
jgi:putative ABC transport system ATP-binding protein/macrolide transport system ATP-binding/permease protein